MYSGTAIIRFPLGYTKSVGLPKCQIVIQSKLVLEYERMPDGIKSSSGNRGLPG